MSEAELFDIEKLPEVDESKSIEEQAAQAWKRVRKIFKPEPPEPVPPEMLEETIEVKLSLIEIEVISHAIGCANHEGRLDDDECNIAYHLLKKLGVPEQDIRSYILGLE